jgi:ketose-bisphosphate aldolase
VIAGFRELLAAARSKGAAVGAFTCYDATTAAGVVLAAEARGDPVVLLLSEHSFRAPAGRLLAAALVAIAAEARVPACVQLDHVDDLELVRRAVGAGIGAVMADGSRRPLAENASLVEAAAALALPVGASVEAELGHVAGDEDAARAAESGALTDPDQARAFVEQTQPACLAVSIGNVHGTYSHPPQLDWDRLAAIADRVVVPLSLHGASGLSDDQIKRALASGISKVNVNTELRERIYGVLATAAADTAAGYRLADLDQALVDAVAEAVERKLALFQG